MFSFRFCSRLFSWYEALEQPPAPAAQPPAQPLAPAAEPPAPAAPLALPAPEPAPLAPALRVAEMSQELRAAKRKRAFAEVVEKPAVQPPMPKGDASVYIIIYVYACINK